MTRSVTAHLLRRRLNEKTNFQSMSREHRYYTYILTHKNNHIFYVGVTNNMKRRIAEHKVATFGTHVGRYNINKLVYFEEHQWIQEAIKREKTIKKWKLEWKRNIISEMNPEWVDLSENWDLSRYKTTYD